MVKSSCRGSCNPKKPAQSNYDNYCRTCFKEKFPRKFAQMTAELYSNPCRLCGEKDLLTGAGICRPCNKARSCSSCKEVNEKKRAPHCKHCAAALLGSVTRSNSGRPAQQPRLATWCTKCFGPEQIASRLCKGCAGKKESLDAVGKECVRCKKTTLLADKASICSTVACRAQLRLCLPCIRIPYGKNYCSECVDKSVK